MLARPYKTKFAYTFHDIMLKALSAQAFFSDIPNPPDSQWDDSDHPYFTRQYLNEYGTATLTQAVDYLDKDENSLINLLFNRYWDEYVFESEEEMLDPLNIQNYPDIYYKARRFIGRIMNLINYTYPKYSAILGAYAAQQSHLMDKLQKIIDGEINNSGYQTHEVSSTTSDTRRDNDTPQDGGNFDDDNHTSFISEGAGSSSGLTTRRDGLKMENDVTESWDTEPIIERLDKVQRLYQKTMEKWLDEFSILFIDGGNYHEN